MDWLKKTGKILLGMSAINNARQADAAIDEYLSEFMRREDLTRGVLTLPDEEVDLDTFGKGTMVNGKITGVNTTHRSGPCRLMAAKGDEVKIRVPFTLTNVVITYDANIRGMGSIRHPKIVLKAEEIRIEAIVSLDRLTGEVILKRCTGELGKITGFRVEIRKYGTFLDPLLKLVVRLTRTEIKRMVEINVQNMLKRGFNR